MHLAQTQGKLNKLAQYLLITSRRTRIKDQARLTSHLYIRQTRYP